MDQYRTSDHRIRCRIRLLNLKRMCPGCCTCGWSDGAIGRDVPGGSPWTPIGTARSPCAPPCLLMPEEPPLRLCRYTVASRYGRIGLFEVQPMTCGRNVVWPHQRACQPVCHSSSSSIKKNASCYGCGIGYGIVGRAVPIV